LAIGGTDPWFTDQLMIALSIMKSAQQRLSTFTIYSRTKLSRADAMPLGAVALKTGVR
jgi:hypothetical protein